MSVWIIVVFIGVVVFATIFGVGENKKGKKTERNPIKGRRVLTQNEQPTFLRLNAALPDHFILAQVSFNAFMTAKGFATRSLFNRKVADFVVLDKNFDVVAIVELDDASHRGREKQDAERDALIYEAGYRVIRYKQTPDIEMIRKDFGLY